MACNKRTFIAMLVVMLARVLRLGTARSRHRAISAAPAHFLRRCSSGTLLHFYAVNSVSRQLKIARTNQIAHQISLAPPANPAAPNPSSCPPFSVAATDTMQPSLSR